MKKIILAITFVILSCSLIGVIRPVGQNHTYSTIQDAVNAASSEDIILVYDGVYEEYIQTNGKVDLIFESVNGPENCIISAPYLYSTCLYANSHVDRFEGFTITGAIYSDTAVDFHAGVNTITNCIFEDNNFYSNGNVLESWSVDEHVEEISNCIFRNNTAQCAIYLNEDYSLGYDPEAYGNYKNNLIEDGMFYIINASSGYHGNFENNTFVDSPYGLYLYLAADVSVKNCIFSSAGINDGPYGPNITVSYSCFTNAGYQNTPHFTWGTGNLVYTDPKFCPVDPYKYHLLEGSPCIDAGDPTTTGGDVRIDMGCFESSPDVKYCEGVHWNWISFPRLERTGNTSHDVTSVLNEFLDWPFDDLTLLHVCEENNPIPTLAYNGTNWSPTSYNVKSSLGYKLNTSEEGDHYLPLEGSRLEIDATNPLDYNLAAGPLSENWMGYWLPESQNIVDAFGNFWTYVEEVWAEDWYYNKNSNNRGIGQSEPTSESTEGKTLEYGKGYIVRFERTNQISGFYWTPSGTVEEPKTKSESENFAFSDKAEYEVIDVVEIPEEVLEIGVFQDNVCVGAVVVDDECEQILVYPDGSSREPVPYNFEIVTNSRSLSLPVRSYQVLNPETGMFETGSIVSGQRSNSVIKFDSFENGQNETPDNTAKLIGNYPNPFNPVTNILFSLSIEQEIELEIYNMKGQLVRNLVQGQFTAGNHSITWDGKDDSGKSVSSGLYFYKLIATDQVISKKMLLLK
ncbi:MAG: T9SS type A sorting domain-containing protein [Candidatus Cloacimonetes bacterium]|nr:T9SS type A sorting domain-containing protein [Candidatus Cloacimonadota bacterium]MCF7815302.1 T9SS type A sorting domain-containing protein [Candidatus Cloacimonadota bacterium]MCF7868847.1 T9SS type A sorting domain-containing protein [Candidatus Cloacimonadota bacterium]MCF7884213.1 T9SS type A sorting domain-containing protein [Candidatus Cloacimonadota bacterium]